jgi:carbon-monoxide dehydrogenase medium subunit
MKPAPFTYHDPRTAAEALALLGKHENAKVLAGGQSLMPMMNFRYVMPDHVVDLNKIGGLAGIDVRRDEIVLGAMTRQRDIEFSAQVKQCCPVLVEALSYVGHRQTRNRGTIGGSLCHFDPSAELAAVVALHDGVLSVEKTGGGRAVAMRDFGQGFMTTAVAPDELMTRVSLPLWAAGHGYAYEEFARRHGDFAIAAAGVLVAADGKGRITKAALVLSGVQPVPVRLFDVDAQLAGTSLSDVDVEAIAEHARSVEAMSDAYVTSAYRQHLSGVLMKRALVKAIARARAGGQGHD